MSNYYIDPGATAYDGIDGDLSSFIKVEVYKKNQNNIFELLQTQENATFPFTTQIDTDYDGEFKITYTVFDSSGLESNAERLVNVVDGSLIAEDEYDFNSLRASFSGPEGFDQIENSFSTSNAMSGMGAKIHLTSDGIWGVCSQKGELDEKIHDQIESGSSDDYNYYWRKHNTNSGCVVFNTLNKSYSKWITQHDLLNNIPHVGTKRVGDWFNLAPEGGDQSAIASTSSGPIIIVGWPYLYLRSYELFYNSVPDGAAATFKLINDEWVLDGLFCSHKGLSGGSSQYSTNTTMSRMGRTVAISGDGNTVAVSSMAMIVASLSDLSATDHETYIYIYRKTGSADQDHSLVGNLGYNRVGLFGDYTEEDIHEAYGWTLIGRLDFATGSNDKGEEIRLSANGNRIVFTDPTVNSVYAYDYNESSGQWAQAGSTMTGGAETGMSLDCNDDCTQIVASNNYIVRNATKHHVMYNHNPSYVYHWHWDANSSNWSSSYMPESDYTSGEVYWKDPNADVIFPHHEAFGVAPDTASAFRREIRVELGRGVALSGDGQKLYITCAVGDRAPYVGGGNIYNILRQGTGASSDSKNDSWNGLRHYVVGLWDKTSSSLGQYVKNTIDQGILSVYESSKSWYNVKNTEPSGSSATPWWDRSTTDRYDTLPFPNTRTEHPPSSGSSDINLGAYINGLVLVFNLVDNGSGKKWEYDSYIIPQKRMGWLGWVSKQIHSTAVDRTGGITYISSPYWTKWNLDSEWEATNGEDYYAYYNKPYEPEFAFGGFCYAPAVNKSVYPLGENNDASFSAAVTARYNFLRWKHGYDTTQKPLLATAVYSASQPHLTRPHLTLSVNNGNIVVVAPPGDHNTGGFGPNNIRYWSYRTIRKDGVSRSRSTPDGNSSWPSSGYSTYDVNYYSYAAYERKASVDFEIPADLSIKGTWLVVFEAWERDISSSGSGVTFVTATSPTFTQYVELLIE